MTERKASLLRIAKEIENCKQCKKGMSGLAVPGEGDPSAKIMFCGEAPGFQESVAGRPFIGRSGKLLRELIRSSGLREEDVFITSPVKYYPGRRAPTREEIEHGMIHTLQQINTINPKLVVLLGATAHKAFDFDHQGILKKHGSILERNGVKFFSTLHPAAVIRNANLKPLMLKDFEKLRDLIRAT